MKSADTEHELKNLLELIYTLVKEIHPHYSKTSVSLDDHFEKDLGLDSLSRVELISRVEEHFHVVIKEQDLYEVQTPQELLKIILGADAQPLINAYLQHSALILDATSSLPKEAMTLVDVLDWHVKQHPDRPHIQMYQDDTKGEVITFTELKERALKVASSLQGLGLKPSQAVAIMLPSSAEYFYTFFGILIAGGIPVPIYPPARPSQLEEHMQRHTRILENAQAAILITIPEAKLVAQLLKSHVQNIKEIVTAGELLQASNPPALPKLHSDDIAFIQYTSGSTGDPKGVMLSHANLLANIRAMGQTVKASSTDVFISWLPLYHDMGLIGAWLGSLYHASLFVVMSPLSFLSKPERWLWAIHHYKGTISAAPNFAYEYVLHRLKDSSLEGLDLSSWRAAFNGAEAVSPVTIKRFSDFFETFGFDPKSMTPVYGLAESSVGLVFPPMKRGPLIDHIDRDSFMKDKIAKPVPLTHSDALEFVTSGLPIIGHEIRVVDETGKELPERHEGALQFRGPSSTRGYYNNPAKTQDLFDEDWLNTGDQAYIAEGELYLTGRIKDIIIRAGRNIYPDQLEKAVGNIEGVRKGCVAIFGTRDKRSGTERLVILAETKVKDEQTRESMRSKITELSADMLGAAADEVVLSEPGSVLKTSSGKIRRDASRILYEKYGGKAHSQNFVWQILRLGVNSLFPRMRRLIHTLLEYLYCGYAWGIILFFTLLSWFSLMLAPKKICWKILATYTKAIAFLTFTPIRVKGIENLEKPVDKTLLIANHASYIDSFVLLATLPYPVRFVAKAELRRSRFLRIPLQKLGIHFVERFETDKSIQDIKALSKVDDNEQPFLFFPEGTFSRVPGLQPFHMGAFTLAVEKGLSILPVVITGSRSILRPGSSFIHAGEIGVSFKEPVTLDAQQKTEDSWHQAITLSQKSRASILSDCKEPDLVYEGSVQ